MTPALDTTDLPDAVLAQAEGRDLHGDAPFTEAQESRIAAIVADALRRAMENPAKDKDEREQSIVASYQSGLSLALTAAEHDVSISSVQAILARRGVQRRSRGGPKREHKRLPEIVVAFERGDDLTTIALAIGVSRERIRQILIKAGHNTAERPLTPSQQAAVDAYRNGETLGVAAGRAGVHPSTLKNWLTRASVPVRPNRRQAQGASKIIADVSRLWNDGLTAAQIGEQLKLPHGVAYRWLSRAGIRPFDRRRTPTIAA